MHNIGVQHRSGGCSYVDESSSRQVTQEIVSKMMAVAVRQWDAYVKVRNSASYLANSLILACRCERKIGRGTDRG